MDITLTGSADLYAAFDRITGRLKGELLEAALAAAALSVVNDAKMRAPWKTGNLRRSIHVGGWAHLTGDFRGKDMGRAPQPRGGAAVQVGTNVEYAKRIEYGFIGTDRLGRRYHQAAKPYLRPALDAMQSKVKSELVAAIKDIVAAHGGSKVVGLNISALG